MKRILLILALLAASFICLGQSTPVEHTNWTVENQGEWGSFYWQVLRVQNNNIFYYYVYTHSNSYYRTKSDGANYDRAITYIRDFNVIMTERNRYGAIYNTIVINVPYVSVDHERSAPVAWFWSYSPYNHFSVKFDDATPYTRSVKY